MSYEWDTRCADLELRRLQDGFDQFDHAQFGAVLFKNFIETQAIVHIETASLLASGEAQVTRSTKRRWEGHISYGGTSSGIKNPVAYAVSELFGTSPKHGGPPSHDYMRPTYNIDEELVEPVDGFFARGHFTPHPEAGS